MKRFASEIVSLALFFADREQTHARSRTARSLAEHSAKVNISHHGKLLQILRRAIDISAYIEQHRGIARGCREDRCQRRTIDARNRAEYDFCRGHRRAGISRGDEAC